MSTAVGYKFRHFRTLGGVLPNKGFNPFADSLKSEYANLLRHYNVSAVQL